ncbi:hypothetical protein AALB64_04855 [Lachnospiraceae bacterium 45-P1]
MRKRKYSKICMGVFLSAAFSFMATVRVPAANYGPGGNELNIQFDYDTQINNPAYDTGWNGGTGPGNTGSNPLGDREKLEENIFSGGPNSEAAQKYMEEEENAFYIHSTYRGGVWQKQENGAWKLFKTDGQPVSSEWAYVDGKTYLIDMYGIMQTGFQKVNGCWYYFNSTGAMQTGWLLKEGKYYFLNSDGSMAYGWVNSAGKWYYLDNNTGVMLTNTYTPDGRYVSAEGELVP